MSNEGIFVFCILDAPQVPQEDGRKGAEHVPKEDDEGMFCHFNQATAMV